MAQNDKVPYSLKLGSTTSEVIEELRKKPLGGKYSITSVIEELIENSPTFISKLKEINKQKSKKKK